MKRRIQPVYVDLATQHNDLEDYPEDGLNAVESYYAWSDAGFGNYSPKKIEALGPDGTKQFTAKEVKHMKTHIEVLRDEKLREEERQAREVFQRVKSEVESKYPPRVPQNVELIMTQNQFGKRTIRGRNVDTGRFVTLSAKPESMMDREFDVSKPPRRAEKK